MNISDIYPGEAGFQSGEKERGKEKGPGLFSLSIPDDLPSKDHPFLIQLLEIIGAETPLLSQEDITYLLWAQAK